MRRYHNVFAATLLIFGIICLSAPPESSIFDQAYYFRSNGGQRGAGATLLGGQGAHSKSQATAQSISASYFRPSALASLRDSDQTPVGVASPYTESPAERVSSSHDDSNPSSSDPPPPQQASHDDPSSTKHEFPFQDNLDLDFPTSALEQFSTHAPLHYNPDGPKTYAYATFMATRNPSLKDPYFLAIQSVVYRILWSSHTHTKKYPFIVFVADFVTIEQRALLSGAGAIVRELAPLEWHCEKEGVQKRWNDLFAKLNMWAETEFERISFLDADAFPLQNIDDMFDVAPVQDCVEAKLDIDDLLPGLETVCEPYIFAGVPQDPFNAAEPNVNVGSMVFTPSTTMHRRLLQNYRKTDHYNCAMAEQAFLNWQFSVDGAFPLTRLERMWGGFFPQKEEEGKLKVVHEKIWVEKEGWLKEEWERGWEEMVRWYGGGEFVERRKGGG